LGIYYDPSEMPTACYAVPALQRRCMQPTMAAPGPLRVLPHVYARAGTGTWPVPTEPIPLGKDFLLGVDDLVEVSVE
jgi:hypothetical protein